MFFDLTQESSEVTPLFGVTGYTCGIVLDSPSPGTLCPAVLVDCGVNTSLEAV